MADEGWERRALETLANDIVVERRRARRWSIFFRLLTLAVIVVEQLLPSVAVQRLRIATREGSPARVAIVDEPGPVCRTDELRHGVRQRAVSLLACR